MSASGNTPIQILRTAVSARTPNVTATYATNSSYIGAGGLALNMTDGIMFSSNGTSGNLFSIGQNSYSYSVAAGGFTANSTLTNAVALNVTNQINTAAISVSNSTVTNIFVVNATGLSTNLVSTFNANVTLTTPLIAGGTPGIAGYVLTSNGSSGSPVWLAAPGSGGGLSGTQIAANNWNFSSLITVSNSLNVTTQINTATLYSTSSINAGSFWVTNSTGEYHTGLMNAASFNTGTFGGAINASQVNTTSIGVGNSFMNVMIGFNSSYSSMANFNMNQNNYVEITVSNANTGTQASQDFIVFDNNGLLSNNFADFGMVGSNWSNATWTISNPSDAYLYSANTNLSIGVAALGGGLNYVNFFTGGQLASNERMRITATGNVGIGNTTPNNTLSVTGSTSLQGNVIFANGYPGQILAVSIGFALT